MSKKFGHLSVICLILFGMISGGIAIAGDSAYEWTATEDGMFTVDFTGTYSYDVYLTDETGSIISNSIKLATAGSPTTDWSFSILKIDDNYALGQPKAVPPQPGQYIDLGQSLNFGFAFVQSGTTYDMYTVGNIATGHSVTFKGTSFDVKGCGIASVKPVPIPGSALLLGSSLLGLVGISTRKKKA